MRNLKTQRGALSALIMSTKLFYGALAILLMWSIADSKSSSSDVPLGTLFVFFTVVSIIAAIVLCGITYMILLLKLEDENVLFWTLLPLSLANFFSVTLIAVMLSSFASNILFPFVIPVAFVLPFVFCLFKAHD